MNIISLIYILNKNRVNILKLFPKKDVIINLKINRNNGLDIDEFSKP